MANAPMSGSFIPKKNTAKKSVQTSARYLGIFGYVSYIAFFGSIFLALGMFLLSLYISGIRAEKESQLVDIRAQFSAEGMQQVQAYDSYLNAARLIFDQSYSLAPILQAFEESIAQPVLFNGVSMEVEGDSFVFSVAAQADTFDATLFQRNVFAELSMLDSIMVNDVRLVRNNENVAEDILSLQQDETINFTLELSILRDDLVFSPQSIASTPVSTQTFVQEEVVEFEEDEGGVSDEEVGETNFDSE